MHKHLMSHTMSNISSCKSDGEVDIANKQKFRRANANLNLLIYELNNKEA